MPITNVDQVLAGARPIEPILKTGIAMEAIGLPHSHFYSVGAPGAAVAPTPGVNGAALTTYLGQIPWTNPAGGLNSHLARLALASTQPCTVLLLDRLWHNSGLSTTLTSLQSITSGAMPARDKNGSTNGDGLLCAIEHSALGGAGVPAITLTYTNEANVGSRTGVLTGVAAPNAGTFERFPLQAGDKGIRSIQGYQANATRTSGTFHLVVYRVITSVALTQASVAGVVDALTGGLARLYDNSVPFLVQIPSAVTLTTLSGEFIATQG